MELISGIERRREVVDRQENAPELVDLHVRFEIVRVSGLRVGQQLVVENDTGVHRFQRRDYAGRCRAAGVMPFRGRLAEQADDLDRPSLVSGLLEYLASTVAIDADWPELKFGTDLTDKGTEAERQRLRFQARPAFLPFRRWQARTGSDGNQLISAILAMRSKMPRFGSKICTTNPVGMGQCAET